VCVCVCVCICTCIYICMYIICTCVFFNQHLSFFISNNQWLVHSRNFLRPGGMLDIIPAFNFSECAQGQQGIAAYRSALRRPQPGPKARRGKLTWRGGLRSRSLVACLLRRRWELAASRVPGHRRARYSQRRIRRVSPAGTRLQNAQIAVRCTKNRRTSGMKTTASAAHAAKLCLSKAMAETIGLTK